MMPNLHVVNGDDDSSPYDGSGLAASYQLVTKTGVSLGEIDLAPQTWPLGLVIAHDGTNLRVLELRRPQSRGERPLLVVEPA